MQSLFDNKLNVYKETDKIPFRSISTGQLIAQIQSEVGRTMTGRVVGMSDLDIVRQNVSSLLQKLSAEGTIQSYSQVRLDIEHLGNIQVTFCIAFPTSIEEITVNAVRTGDDYEAVNANVVTSYPRAQNQFYRGV